MSCRTFVTLNSSVKALSDIDNFVDVLYSPILVKLLGTCKPLQVKSAVFLEHPRSLNHNPKASQSLIWTPDKLENEFTFRKFIEQV